MLRSLRPRVELRPIFMRPRKRKRVTICIGILATGGTSIVCVADKSVSYSEDIQGDTDSSKIVPVGPNGCHAMISGSESTISRILSKLKAEADLGKDVEQTKKFCEDAYRSAESEILEAAFLYPFLTLEEYTSALMKERVNPIIKSISERVERARQEQTPVSCGLILCGFDGDGHPYLLSLSSPGLCTDMTHTGFCAVGSGSGYALQKLLQHEWDRTRALDRTLYECFDAKASAENDPGVGYDWDAVILTRDKVGVVPKSIKVMIDRAWTDHVRSPYASWDFAEDLPKPPANWKFKLRKYVSDISKTSYNTGERTC